MLDVMMRALPCGLVFVLIPVHPENVYWLKIFSDIYSKTSTAKTCLLFSSLPRQSGDQTWNQFNIIIPLWKTMTCCLFLYYVLPVATGISQCLWKKAINTYGFSYSTHLAHRKLSAQWCLRYHSTLVQMCNHVCPVFTSKVMLN